MSGVIEMGPRQPAPADKVKSKFADDGWLLRLCAR